MRWYHVVVVLGAIAGGFTAGYMTGLRKARSESGHLPPGAEF